MKLFLYLMAFGWLEREAKVQVERLLLLLSCLLSLDLLTHPFVRKTCSSNREECHLNERPFELECESRSQG